MAECGFDDEETANIVLQLLEEVEGNGYAEYPLQYYIDAAKDHKDLDRARNFLLKECDICIMEKPIPGVGMKPKASIPGHIQGCLISGLNFYIILHGTSY